MTRLLTLALLVCVGLSALACGPASSTFLPGPQANLPADTVPAVADFNPPAYIDTATLAAANLEAVRVKSIAIQYIALHAGAVTLTSDDLARDGTGQLKAWYRFNSAASITRVEAVPGGWTEIVFSLAQQKWVRGIPDRDHPADQDIP